MAKAARRKVSIQYRRLDDLTGAFGNLSLQHALINALQHETRDGPIGGSVARRIYDRDKVYGTIALNKYQDDPDFFFAEMIRFEPGADLPLVEIAANSTVYNLTQQKAPDGHEPARGTLHFIVIGNHVLLLESDLSASRVEGYLGWLLAESTGTVAATAVIVLAAELGTKSGGTQLTEVGEVVFKPQPIVEAPARDLFQEPLAGSERLGVAETNTLAVLMAAGLAEADINELVNNRTSIEIILQIKFKDQRQQRLRTIGAESANRLLRNMPDESVTLYGPAGRQQGGKIVKLAYPAQIEMVGSHLSTADVARALHEAYRYFLSNGHIGE